jgi:hypothetical protein
MGSRPGLLCVVQRGLEASCIAQISLSCNHFRRPGSSQQRKNPTMSNETIVKAEKSHYIQYLSDCRRKIFEIGILAWAIPHDEGKPVPITAEGRFVRTNSPSMIWDGMRYLPGPSGEIFQQIMKSDGEIAIQVVRTTVAETIIRAKKFHLVHILNEWKSGTIQVDVVAWAVGSSGPPVPITAAGRFDPDSRWVVSHYGHLMGVPGGKLLRNELEAIDFLRGVK